MIASQNLPSSLVVIDIALADVDVDAAHWIDPDVVTTLAASIQHTGYLLHPLLVHQRDERYVLMAGFHRYAALQQLGWTTVPVSLLSACDPDILTWTGLQENLCRKDMPALELVWSLGKAKELYLKLFPATDKSQNRAKKTEQDEETHPPFIEYAANLQHRSRTNIGLYLTTYARLEPTLYPVLYTIPELVDTITNLSTLAAHSKDDQHRIVQQMQGSVICTFQQAVARIAKEHEDSNTEESSRGAVHYEEEEKEEEQEEITHPHLTPSLGYDEEEEEQPETHEQAYERMYGTGQSEEEKEEGFRAILDLADVVSALCEEIEDYLRGRDVYDYWAVKIRKDSNTKGRTRILISLQA